MEAIILTLSDMWEKMTQSLLDGIVCTSGLRRYWCNPKWNGISQLIHASCKIQGLPCLFISILTVLHLFFVSPTVSYFASSCHVQLADLCKQRHFFRIALLSRDSQKVVRVLDSLIPKEKRSGCSKGGNYCYSSAIVLKLSVKRKL